MGETNWNFTTPNPWRESSQDNLRTPLGAIPQLGTSQSFSLSSTDGKKLLYLIQVTTASGKHWFVTCIDDHSHLTWVFLPTDKSEFLIETLSSKGIVHWSSCAYTSQQNDVAKPENLHFLEVLHLQTPLECLKEFYPSTRLIPDVPLCSRTTEHDHDNLCVEDDIVNVVKDDKTNMTVPKENKTARSDVTLTNTKGTRSCTKHSMRNHTSYSNMVFTTSLDTAIIPKNINEAMRSPEWKMVVMEEMEALEKNKAWDLCTLPKGHKTVGCKWMFALKYKANGTLNREWFDRVTTFVRSQGFSQEHSDHTSGTIVVSIVYVDDIVLLGDDIVEIISKKQGVVARTGIVARIGVEAEYRAMSLGICDEI
ncbi:reverse transcriptase [Cucumis melo var. makuwa]|uniref:Reverse transcriptase n=1 Tax=Cucumis melo var. makuwa TaxID=1194695 RepID=A0A5D3DQX4_CUCMM|nr:reverse transcriptase [Cucumis melo var. makuwa]TYK26053.1 reverse transcriptase [Cucumis melo var. makuwa]